MSFLLKKDDSHGIKTDLSTFINKKENISEKNPSRRVDMSLRGLQFRNEDSDDSGSDLDDYGLSVKHKKTKETIVLKVSYSKFVNNCKNGMCVFFLGLFLFCLPFLRKLLNVCTQLNCIYS